MYQLTNNPDAVINTDTGATIPNSGNWQWSAYEEWLAAGNTPLPVTLPTFADYAAVFMSSFTSWIEDVVHANAYDSSLSCASYVTSAVPQFQKDAAALIAWRDALWVWASAWQQGFNGAIPTTLPTWDEIKAQAPQPEAYGWVVHAPGQIIDVSSP